jgi:CBS domain-containing protein
MIARDVMTSPVIVVESTATVRDAATLFLKHQISAVPVVDRDRKLVGIITEGDLMRRTEAGTERRHSWLSRLFLGEGIENIDYVKSHTRRISDLMKRDVITVRPETTLNEIADILESRHIKRVPVVNEGGDLVGIVSRANLVQAIVSAKPKLDVRVSDTTIREGLVKALDTRPWTRPINITVSNGVVDLWGIVGSEEERTAIRVATENAQGVLSVNDHLLQRPTDWT